jgi:hypothetical protein
MTSETVHRTVIIDDYRYRKFVEFCTRVGVKPMPEEEWRRNHGWTKQLFTPPKR